MTWVTLHVTILYCDILEGLLYRRRKTFLWNRILHFPFLGLTQFSPTGLYFSLSRQNGNSLTFETYMIPCFKSSQLIFVTFNGTMSLRSFTKFMGNSVSGLWEGKPCEDSSGKLDTNRRAERNPNKGLFSSNHEEIRKCNIVLTPSFLPLFSARQATSNYVFVQARDHERSKEQTKERGHKGISLFPQNPTRIEDVPFRWDFL